jgi:lysophospholipase L1-like esterase
MIKKVIFTALILVLFLAISEITVRFLEYVISDEALGHDDSDGWQSKFFINFLDWHEPDPDLLWRFRANLNNPLIKTNSDHILGSEISRPKPPRTYRVLILGDSSPVGLGLKSRMFAFDAILNYLLEDEYITTTNIDVINASVSGYTSEQIAAYLNLKGRELEPDLVVLYCGNNDASVSGQISDQAIMEKQRLKKARHLFDNLAVYRTLRTIIIRLWKGTTSSDNRLAVRVTAERFGENLENIASQCRDHNCPLIILKPPVPRLWPAGLQFKLFSHISDEDGRLIIPDKIIETIGRKVKYCIDQTRFREIYGTGDIFTQEVYQSAYDDNMTPEEAIEYFSERLSQKGSDAVLYNNLGVSFWENSQYLEADYSLKTARGIYRNKFKDDSLITSIAAGSPFLYNIGINYLSKSEKGLEELNNPSGNANIYLDSALQADYFSLRIKQAYWDVIDSFNDRDSVTVINLPEIFNNNGGEKLFIDHCHPTAKGHYIIAEEILKVIKSRYQP